MKFRTLHSSRKETCLCWVPRGLHIRSGPGKGVSSSCCHKGGRPSGPSSRGIAELHRAAVALVVFVTQDES